MELLVFTGNLEYENLKMDCTDLSCYCNLDNWLFQC